MSLIQRTGHLGIWFLPAAPRAPPTYLQVLTVGDGFAGPIAAGEVVLFLVYI
jgi:hypothetical protein